MESPVWRSVVMDGVTYYWTAYSTETRTDSGPWQPVEFLVLARRPETPGVGYCLPAGTVVGEEHAIAAVRFFLENGEPIP